MKHLNKKGFTIVELVIVIAIIAILAAVMIPTFSGVIEKANKSAAFQEAKNQYTEDLAGLNADASNYKAAVAASYVPTEDTAIDPDKDYYTSEGVKIDAPVVDDIATYYELVPGTPANAVGVFSAVVNGNYTYTYTTEDGVECVYDSATNVWKVDGETVA